MNATLQHCSPARPRGFRSLCLRPSWASRCRAGPTARIPFVSASATSRSGVVLRGPHRLGSVRSSSDLSWGSEVSRGAQTRPFRSSTSASSWGGAMSREPYCAGSVCFPPSPREEARCRAGPTSWIPFASASSLSGEARCRAGSTAWIPFASASSHSGEVRCRAGPIARIPVAPRPPRRGVTRCCADQITRVLFASQGGQLGVARDRLHGLRWIRVSYLVGRH